MAATLVLSPSADTTLSENYATNNLGALRFINAGTTQNRTRNRALLRFDLSGLPPGTCVRAAALMLEVVGEPNEPPAFADFSLHRVLRSWTEGRGTSPTNCVSCQGQGSPSAKGEATWWSRSAFETEWDAPGGALGLDFALEPSVLTTVYGISGSPYEFSSTSLIVSDVQFWIDEPAANYGWALICQSEDVPFTARRFGAREDTENAPRLTIDFVAPPRLESAKRNNAEFEFSFRANPGEEYRAEYTGSLQGPWQLLRTIEAVAEPTLVVVRDPLGPAKRFYRVVAR